MKLPLVKNNGVLEIAVHDFYAVKSPVFPFNKFRGVDTILGPEMRSTGEVMGVSTSYGQAFAKAQLAAGQRLPLKGHSLPQRQRSRQAPGRPARQRSEGARIPSARDARNGGRTRSRRHRSRTCLQGERRPSEHRRPRQNPQDRSHHQHAARPRIVLRREVDPPRGNPAQRSLHHNAIGGARRCARHQGAARSTAGSRRVAGFASRPRACVGQRGTDDNGRLIRGPWWRISRV